MSVLINLKPSINTENYLSILLSLWMGMGVGQNNNQTSCFWTSRWVEAVRDTVEGAAEIGVKYLTLYAFSTENWNRPKLEIDALDGTTCQHHQ